MVGEILPPSMEDSSNAGGGAKIFPVSAKFQEGLGYRLEEEGVGGLLVAEKEGVELIRHSKDNMEIAGIKQIGTLLFDPLLS